MSRLLGESAYRAARKQTEEKLRPVKNVIFKIFKERNPMKKNRKYNHNFSLRVGEIVHINGIPCEYLGRGNFGSNTYPGKPRFEGESI